MTLAIESGRFKALVACLLLAQILAGCAYLREEGWISPKENAAEEETETIAVDASRRGNNDIEPIESAVHQGPAAPAGEPRVKPRVTALNAQEFTGLQPEEIEELLGAPSAISMQGPILIWQYDSGPCSATFQFFKEVETEIYRLLQYDFAGGAETYCLGRIERRKFG